MSNAKFFRFFEYLNMAAALGMVLADAPFATSMFLVLCGMLYGIRADIATRQ